MQEDIDFQKHNSEEISPINRETPGDSPSFHLCSSSSKTPTTTTNRGNQKGMSYETNVLIEEKARIELKWWIENMEL